MHAGAFHMAELFGRGYFALVAIAGIGILVAAASFALMKAISFLADHIVFVS